MEIEIELFGDVGERGDRIDGANAGRADIGDDAGGFIARGDVGLNQRTQRLRISAA